VRVILVVLALIWVVALTPTILRKLAEREFSYSVAKFHRSQRAMRRAYPGQVAMAGVGNDGGFVGMGRREPSAGANANAARKVPLHAAGRRPAGSAGPDLDAPTLGGPVASAAVRPVGPSAQRRRRVLGVLGGTLLGSFLFGFVPGLGALWDLSLATLVLTAGYVALLVHFRRVAIERSEKVVFLEAPAAVAPVQETPRVHPFRPAESGRAPAFRILPDRTPVAAGG
jgi:hypothetical protein